MSTASKWFVPDEEYVASVEDYAVVGTPATYVMNHLINDPEYHCVNGWFSDESKATFRDVLYLPQACGDVFSNHSFVESSQLIYADVDRTNKDHVQMVKSAAKAGLVETESKSVKDMKEKILEYTSLSAIQSCCTGFDSDEETTNSEREEQAEDEEKASKAAVKRVRKFLNAADGMGPVGCINPKMIDFVLGLEGEEERRLALTVLSRQYLRKNPRPVLLLLGMVDKYTKGVKEGWLMAYDFYKNKIVIKPYHAVNGTEHPLAERWDVELPDDGVSWSGHPAEFIMEKIVPLQEAIRKNKANDRTATYGYKLVAYFNVLQWIRCRHWDAFASMKTPTGGKPLNDEVQDTVWKCGRAIGEETEMIPFPYSKDDSERYSLGSMSRLQSLQESLEDNEFGIRDDALDAQKAGKEERAQNMAKVYDNLLEQLRSFNMNPDKPL